MGFARFSQSSSNWDASDAALIFAALQDLVRSEKTILDRS